MRKQAVLRNVFALALAAASLITAGPLLAQGEKRTVAGGGGIPDIVRPATCPQTSSVTLDANTPYVLTTDIGSIHDYTTQLNWGLNLHPPHPTGNKAYLHTFVWNRGHRCCQVVSGVMKIQMTALQVGSNPTSSQDAGNDNVSIIHGGLPVPPYNQRIYTGLSHFSAGQTVTKPWTLNAAALHLLNTNGYLTLYVEDDTSVTSATLQLTVCCLTK
jgi:hypothetical protein